MAVHDALGCIGARIYGFGDSGEQHVFRVRTDLHSIGARVFGGSAVSEGTDQTSGERSSDKLDAIGAR